MNSIRVGKGVDILRGTLFIVFLAVIGSSACLADQLQWNARSVCAEARQAISRESLLISYCSQANVDYVEVWLVRGAYIIETSAEGLFEVFVLAKPLYRSQKAFSSVDFPVPTDRWRFNDIRNSGWTIEGIDLAYTYIYTGNGSFQCLGKVLELDCHVGVETISLPGDVMETLMSRTRLGHNISLQSLEFLPAQPSGSFERIP
ncbi:MAG: hypothetical protein V3T03_02890 [Candidatus Bipolaricaulota bacterium]